MAIFHCPIKPVSRGKGKSAVAAAAYRSGEKITNEYDGVTHDYTKKGGVVHTEILLPPHAPPSFSDRSTLWNAVEKVEKSKNAQLARDIEIALPIELSREEHIRLVREYCSSQFVSKGMCADLCVHDKNDGNPHSHLLLTMRPLNEDGTWGYKQRKKYILDENGEKIYDPVKRQYQCETVQTTDWNEQTKAEEWRAAWAEHINRYLEQAGHTERVDHRSYKRQGIDKIPTVHMGAAAMQMERRGIATERGNLNREIEKQNKLLKEIKARITRLDRWAKEQKAKPAPITKMSIMEQLQQAQQQANASRYSKIKNLKAQAAVLNFLQDYNISGMAELAEKISAMHSDYYALRGEIRADERRIEALTEHARQYAIYDKLKGKKRSESDDILYHSAGRYLTALKERGEAITPKKWRSELAALIPHKDTLYEKMRAMREDIKTVEQIRKAAEQLAKTEQTNTKKHEQER